MFSANKHLGDMFKTATHHYTAKESTSVSFKLWSMVAYMMDLHGQHKEDMYWGQIWLFSKLKNFSVFFWQTISLFSQTMRFFLAEYILNLYFKVFPYNLHICVFKNSLKRPDYSFFWSVFFFFADFSPFLSDYFLKHKTKILVHFYVQINHVLPNRCPCGPWMTFSPVLLTIKYLIRVPYLTRWEAK